MTIRLTCAKCGSQLKVKDELAGKQGHCPKCKADLVIPALPTADVVENPIEFDDAEGDAPAHAAGDDEAPLIHNKPGRGRDLSDDPDASMSGRETVSSSAPHEETALSMPLSLSPDDDDLDEAPVLLSAAPPPSLPKPKAKPKPKSEDFDPAEFLMVEDPTEKPTAKKPPPRNRPNLDLLEEQYAQAQRSEQALESRPVMGTSNASAADAWDHAKAAKQMMKAIKQSNTEERKSREEPRGESFDFVGAFRELGVKAVGGVAVVLIAAYGLYFLANMAMGGGPKLPPLGYVTGMVKLDGKPLEGVTIYFSPYDPEGVDVKRERYRTSTGVTDANGLYRMYYIEKHQGVAIGKSRVWLSLMGPQGRDLIPSTYADGAGQMRDVAAGSQKIDFELTSR